MAERIPPLENNKEKGKIGIEADTEEVGAVGKEDVEYPEWLKDKDKLEKDKRGESLTKEDIAKETQEILGKYQKGEISREEARIKTDKLSKLEKESLKTPEEKEEEKEFKELIDRKEKGEITEEEMKEEARRIHLETLETAKKEKEPEEDIIKETEGKEEMTIEEKKKLLEKTKEERVKELEEESKEESKEELEEEGLNRRQQEMIKRRKEAKREEIEKALEEATKELATAKMNYDKLRELEKSWVRKRKINEEQRTEAEEEYREAKEKVHNLVAEKIRLEVGDEDVSKETLKREVGLQEVIAEIIKERGKNDKEIENLPEANKKLMERLKDWSKDNPKQAAALKLIIGAALVGAGFTIPGAQFGYGALWGIFGKGMTVTTANTLWHVAAGSGALMGVKNFRELIKRKSQERKGEKTAEGVGKVETETGAEAEEIKKEEVGKEPEISEGTEKGTEEGGKKEEEEEKAEKLQAKLIPEEEFRKRFEKVRSPEQINEEDLKDLREHLLARVQEKLLKEKKDITDYDMASILSEHLFKEGRIYGGIIEKKEERLAVDPEKWKRMNPVDYLKRYMDMKDSEIEKYLS